MYKEVRLNKTGTHRCVSVADKGMGLRRDSLAAEGIEGEIGGKAFFV